MGKDEEGQEVGNPLIKARISCRGIIIEDTRSKRYFVIAYWQNEYIMAVATIKYHRGLFAT